MSWVGGGGGMGMVAGFGGEAWPCGEAAGGGGGAGDGVAGVAVCPVGGTGTASGGAKGGLGSNTALRWSRSQLRAAGGMLRGLAERPATVVLVALVERRVTRDMMEFSRASRVASSGTAATWPRRWMESCPSFQGPKPCVP